MPVIIIEDVHPLPHYLHKNFYGGISCHREQYFFWRFRSCLEPLVMWWRLLTLRPVQWVISSTISLSCKGSAVPPDMQSVLPEWRILQRNSSEGQQVSLAHCLVMPAQACSLPLRLLLSHSGRFSKMKAFVPQYLHRPNKIAMMEMDEFGVLVQGFSLALILKSFFLIIVGIAAFFLYRVAKAKYPRGFLKHIPYIVGLKQFHHFPNVFITTFRE